MTVTYVGGTGVSTTASAKGTTSTTVAYNNVSAGRLAVLTVGVKPNTATISTPSGWTPIGETTGGTGTNAADTGQSKVALFVKELTGSETGSETVNATSSSCVEGSIDVFGKTRGFWDYAAFVVGNDSTHGTNFSAVCGAWASATGGVWAGDHMFVAHTGDTDDATTATSAPTITQSGMTISSVTARSEVRNNSGNQGRIATWSGTVGAATTPGTSNFNAPTVGFTWSVSSCGPAMVLRIREYDNVSTLVDDFATGSVPDSAKWPATSGTVSVSGGTLRVNANASGYGGVFSAGAYKLKGNKFVIQFPAVQTGAGSYGGVRIAPYDVNTFTGFYFDPSGGQTSFENMAGGSDAGFLSIAYTSGVETYRQIDYTGANILLQTSTNGTSWTTQRTITPSAWHDYTNLIIIIEAGGSPTVGDVIQVDNVNNPPSTTPVSGTLDLRWAVQNTVTDSIDLRWAVQNTISGTMDLRWAVLAPVTGTLDLQWAQRAVISGTLDLPWKVRSVVASTLDLRWAVLAQISGGVDLRWAVLNAISGTLDLRWISIARIAGTLDLRWAVRNVVAGTTDLRWAVLNSVAGTLDLRWAQRSLVIGSMDLRWAVLATVAGSLDLRWAVLAPVSGSMDLRWIVLNQVTGDLDLRWIVVSTITTISGSLDLRWAVRNLTSGALDLQWPVRNLVSGGVDLRWTVRSSVSSSIDLRWAVLAPVSGTLSLPWAVRSQISGLLDLPWRVRALLTSSLQLLWVVEGAPPPDQPLPSHVRSLLTDRLVSYPEPISQLGEDHIRAYLELWP